MKLVRDQRGAIMVIGLFMALMLTGMMYMMLGVAEAAAHREQLQDGADAGASAATAVYARGMNLATQYNELLKSAMATYAAVQYLIDAQSFACWNFDEFGRPISIKDECTTAQNRARNMATNANNELGRLQGRALEPVARDAVAAINGRVGPTIFLMSAPELEFEETSRLDRDIAARVEAWLTNNADRFTPELVNPVPGSSITDDFGFRGSHPVTGRPAMHYGTDFGAPEGAEIFAAGDGVVVSMGYSSIGGNEVVIAHDNGLRTRYLHLSRFHPDTRVGRRVVGGTDVIGYVGSTGRVTGPHLHFEVYDGGRPVDPEDYLGESAALEISTALARQAVATTRSQWRSRNVMTYRELNLDVRDTTVQVGAVQGLDALARSDAGVVVGTFGASGGGLSELRSMGQVAWAQGAFEPGSLDAPEWRFRLARFTLDPREPIRANGACGRVGGGTACNGLNETVRRLGRASTK